MFNYPESSTCWGQHRQARLAYTLALISKLMAPMNISLQSTVFQSLTKQDQKVYRCEGVMPDAYNTSEVLTNMNEIKQSPGFCISAQ